MRASKILVVDDFDEFRQFVCRKLQPRVELQVIGQAADGLEAVQKAQELQPDIVLLDIGLPELNGIEAGRRIRELCPDSKVLFCSLDSSNEMVEKALQLGALGYLLKADAGRELLVAMDTVLQGRLYISKGLDHNALKPILDGHIVERPRPEETPEPRPRQEHVVTCYSGEASFVDDFVRFIESALRDEKVVIVIVNELHRRKFFERLQEHGWDPAAVVQQGRLRFVDVNDALSMFMVNDWPDPARLLKAIDDLVLGAAKAVRGKRPRVAACGELAPTLWGQGKLEAAIELEHLWDQIARSHGIDTLCGYPLSARLSEEGTHAWQRICAEHSDIRVY